MFLTAPYWAALDLSAHAVSPGIPPRWATQVDAQGRPHGPQYEFSSATGYATKVVSYWHGKLHGDEITFADGAVVRVATHQHGTRVRLAWYFLAELGASPSLESLWVGEVTRTYRRDGSLRLLRAQRGSHDVQQEFSAAGKLWLIIRSHGGPVSSRTIFWATGAKQSRQYFRNGTANGWRYEWNQQGQLVSRSLWERGTKVKDYPVKRT